MITASDTPRDRAIVRAYGPDEEAVERAIAAAIAQGQTHGIRRVGVVVHGLPQIGRVAEILGAPNPRRVERDKVLRTGGVTLEFFNERRWGEAQGIPQVCLWLTDDDMAKVERGTAPATVLVTWTDKEGRAWAVGHEARDLRGGDPADDLASLDPVVRAALDSIAVRVNPSDSLSHPSDKAATVRALQLLHRAGYDITPAAVRAYLTRRRLSDHTARAVADIAHGVTNGHQYRVRGPGWREDILEQWCREAGDGHGNADAGPQGQDVT